MPGCMQNVLKHDNNQFLSIDRAWEQYITSIHWSMKRTKNKNWYQLSIPLNWFFKDDLVTKMYDLHTIQRTVEKNAKSTTMTIISLHNKIINTHTHIYIKSAYNNLYYFFFSLSLSVTSLLSSYFSLPLFLSHPLSLLFNLQCK